jgi:polar amino acid transport system substrate-binding protein
MVVFDEGRHACDSLAAMLAFQPASAAEPEIPQLWDSKERLQKPDLTQLQRLRFLTTTDFARSIF